MGSDEGSEKRYVVQIPSYAEALEHDRPKACPNLFRPSQQDGLASNGEERRNEAAQQSTCSFRETFAFVKKTEFYAAPPVPSAAPAAQAGNMGAGNSLSVPAPLPCQVRNAIVVSKRQLGNPVLKHIRNVRWVFGEIVPDYLLGQNSCALFISLRYHLLHPEYLFFRIRELQKSYRLRVVLCHVDLEDVIKPLHEITQTALLNDCSLVCAWSLEESARYLETLKSYENKPADAIQERTDNDYLSRLTGAVTTLRHINKTDVVTLGSTFGSLAAIVGGSMEDFARCPGIGERKVKRLYDAFNEPFRRPPKLRLSNVPREPEEEPETIGEASTSKLVSEPEVSVRDALNAARSKYQVRSNVELHSDDNNIGTQPEPADDALRDKKRGLCKGRPQEAETVQNEEEEYVSLE